MAEKFDINVVIDNARRVLTNPAGYYRDMAKSGGFANPVIFVAVMAAVMGLITAILSLFSSPVGLFAAGFAAVIIMPIAAVIGSFIGAAILFVIWKLMGSEENYETAYRCLSAATAIYPVMAVISIIPYLGTIVGVIWGTYLIIVASEIVHGRDRKTATIVFGILAVLMLIANIGSEHASRQLSEKADDMEKMFEDYSKLPPEEQGKKMGEFLKGLEEGRDGGS